MDKPEFPVGDETDEKGDSYKMEIGDCQGFEIPTEEQEKETATSALELKLKHFPKESKEFLDDQQLKDTDSIQETIRKTAKEKDDFSKDLKKQIENYMDDISVIEDKVSGNTVLRFRKGRKNIRLTIKNKEFATKKGIMRIVKMLKDKRHQIIKKNPCSSQTTKGIKMLKGEKNLAESQKFKDPSLRGRNVKKRKLKLSVKKLMKKPLTIDKSKLGNISQKPSIKFKLEPRTSYESTGQSTSTASIDSKDASNLSAVQSTLARQTLSEIKSTIRVLAHFRWYMQTNSSPLKSKNADSIKPNEAETEYALIQNSRKVINNISSTEHDETVASAGTIPCVSAITSEASRSSPHDLRLVEEVLAHFRWFMRSKNLDFDLKKSDNSERKIEADIESKNRDSKKRSKAYLEDVMAQNPKKVRSNESSTQRDNESYISVQPASADITPYVSEVTSESAKVRTAEEVLTHFRLFMQSKTVDFEVNRPSDINKELERPIKSENEDSYLLAKTIVESPMEQNSKKGKSNLSASTGGNASATIKNASTSQRQRTAVNEKCERTRCWLIHQINDKEISLKITIMEGKYSGDNETKMKCIENAKLIQSKIDKLYNALDNHDKLESSPIKVRGFFNSAKDDSSEDSTSNEETNAPSTKRTKGSKGSDKSINSLLTLFRHLYKYKDFEFDNEYILERINANKLMAAYNEYLNKKEKLDIGGQKLEVSVIKIVEEFHQSLVKCRSTIKSEIPRSDLRSLEDWQDYITDLQMAAGDNSECLHMLMPLVTSIIFPLMSYLSLSRIKIVQMIGFLSLEQLDILTGSSYINKVFFESLGQHHSEN